MTWLLAAAELGLLILLTRGSILLWPVFACYLVVSIIGWILRSFSLYEQHLMLNVFTIPIKALCVYEAVKMRAQFIISSTPRLFHGKELRGETWLLGRSSLWLALVVMVLVGYFWQVQFNVSQTFMRIHLVAQSGLTALLVITWMYFQIRRATSPARSRAHHALLTLWFLLFTSVNMVHVGKGEATKWWVLNYGSMAGGLVLVLLWIKLFWPTQSRAVVAVSRPERPQSSACEPVVHVP